MISVAVKGFRQYLLENPDRMEIIPQILEIVSDPMSWDAAMHSRAEGFAAEEVQRIARCPPATKGLRVIMDATDLFSHLRQSPIPSGIQRVQLVLIEDLLQILPNGVIVTYVGGSTGWVRIPAAFFGRIAALAQRHISVEHAEWIDCVEMLAILRHKMPEMTFLSGDILLNLGASWADGDYLGAIKSVQRGVGVRYVPFVHDLIPAICPDLCAMGVAEQFLEWLSGALDHASLFLTNSQATAADLLAIAGRMGTHLSQETVRVVPLDGKAELAELHDGELRSGWAVAPGGYILFVATIEARKNHLLAFRAWQNMLHNSKSDREVPVLVCVGRKGWFADDAFALLEDDPTLAASVRILSDIGDGDLATLYQYCCFTVYPSAREGWGLPVTESLSFGKIPVIPRVASMPEAGKDLAVYLDELEPWSIQKAVERLWNDALAREALEQRIATEFRPRKWKAVAEQIYAELTELSNEANPKSVSIPHFPLDMLCAPGGFRSAITPSSINVLDEALDGRGWRRTAEAGPSVSASRADLLFRVPDDLRESRCHLLLSNMACESILTRISSGERSFRVDLPAKNLRWVSFVCPVVAGIVRIHLAGVALDGPTPSDLAASIGPSISGMAVCRAGGPRTTAELAHTISKRSNLSDHALIGAMWTLYRSRNPKAAEFDTLLTALERGELDRYGLIRIASESAEAAESRRLAVVFD